MNRGAIVTKSQAFYQHIEQLSEDENTRMRIKHRHQITIKKFKNKRHFKPYDHILKLLRKLKRHYYINEIPTYDKSWRLLILDDYFTPIGRLTILPSEYFNNNLFDNYYYTLNIDLNDMLSFETQDIFVQTVTTVATKYKVSLHAWVGKSSITQDLYQKYGFEYTGYKTNVGQIKLYTNHSTIKGGFYK